MRLCVFKFLSLSLIVYIILVISGNAYAERFFQTNSTWYEKIPDNPTLNPRSAEHVADIILNHKGLNPNYRDWSPPIWKADPSTRNIQVMTDECARDANHPSCASATRVFQQEGWDIIPIPVGAKAAGNDAAVKCWPGYCRDGDMIVISADKHWAWDFARAIYFPTNYGNAACTASATPWKCCMGSGTGSCSSRLAGKWVVKYLRRWDLTGDGVNYPYDLMGGTNYAKVPNIHGLITYNEVVNEGTINHALAFAYYGAERKAHMGIYPSGAYNEGVPDSRPGAMLGGERLYLDKSVNCNTVSTKNFVKMVCKAMQDYGMIFILNDGVGSNSVFLENLEDKPEKWTGIVSSLSEIPLNKLHVVEPIYPTKRGNTSLSSPLSSKK